MHQTLGRQNVLGRTVFLDQHLQISCDQVRRRVCSSFKLRSVFAAPNTFVQALSQLNIVKTSKTDRELPQRLGTVRYQRRHGLKVAQFC